MSSPRERGIGLCSKHDGGSQVWRASNAAFVKGTLERCQCRSGNNAFISPHLRGQVVLLVLFPPFAAVSLPGVAVFADTFPSLPVSGPFIPDVPPFQVLHDSVFPSQHQSSSRALTLHFNNCSDVFSFISSFDVPEPFQHSLSYDHRYLFPLDCSEHVCVSKFGRLPVLPIVMPTWASQTTISSVSNPPSTFVNSLFQ